MLDAGKDLTDKQRSNRSFMEGVSCWPSIARMRLVNSDFLQKPYIVELDVATLKAATVEAEYKTSGPNTGHHDLFGPKQPMLDACSDYHDEAEAS